MGRATAQRKEQGSGFGSFYGEWVQMCWVIINNYQVDRAAIMPNKKKTVRKTSLGTKSVLTASSRPSLSQVKPEPYRSLTPNFLLSLVDNIIKADTLQALRLDFQYYPLEELVAQLQEVPNLIWIFADPKGEINLLSQAPHGPFPRPSSLPGQETSPSSLTCQNILAKKVPQCAQDELKHCQLISLDHIRLRCEANLYVCPKAFTQDLRSVFAWSQLFRCGSLKTFQYISSIFQKTVATLDKKDFFKKFNDLKTQDLARLMQEQIYYKIECKEWPVIPSNFREYEEIEQYVPSPSGRDQSIQRRIQSQKVPQECGPHCVCVDQIPEGQSFCTFSLVHGWQTRCPNRANKIECQHSDPALQAKCRNSEIQKHQRKSCKNERNPEGQIEERIAWGIDLYTRNVIYHCLPEIDIEGLKERVPNQQRKNTFIQTTLTKAFNLLGNQGFSLQQVCHFILRNSPKEGEGQNIIKTEKEQSIKTQKEQSLMKLEKEHLFSRRDGEYADLLLKNYEMAEDKTAFRVHTKGKGAICIDPAGIEQGTFLIEYFGEIYEPWRWYDREDFIKEIMKKKKMKNHVPEFYNIAMEKHNDEPLGCDMLMVDPSRKGNFSSRFSHSCDPNCGTIITVSKGRYFIGMYTFRKIIYGEELTFDYCSMTESSYEHFNSICLCGMKKCRGYYLQLSNTKMFTSLMDNKNCFFTRNSAILKANEPPTQQQRDLCATSNIKEGFLEGAPLWLVGWIASVLSFIEEEGEVYQRSLTETWKKDYPWQNAENEEQKEENIRKYSLTSRQELESIRFQNLLTSVDKIKYFYEHNSNKNPPIYVEDSTKVLDVMVAKDDSVLKELQDNLIRYKMLEIPKEIEVILQKLAKLPTPELKVSLFRLSCLLISHKLSLIVDASFNHQLLGDIVFFYAFTHTYFSASEFHSFDAEEITITASQILGEKASPTEKRERSCKKYASPFVWGQMASWFKQTIVCPEASLSQDRRGTLSYPLIRSIMKSEYPYEKKTRQNFLKMIREKPTGSWPPAKGCDLSFKNPYKLYGTMLFESVHSKEKLLGELPKETLLESCLFLIDSPLREKLAMFKRVERILGGLPQDHGIYELVEMGGDLDAPIPKKNPNSLLMNEPRKRHKKDESDSA